MMILSQDSSTAGTLMEAVVEAEEAGVVEEAAGPAAVSVGDVEAVSVGSVVSVEVGVEATSYDSCYVQFL
jgi:hypothetical protein